MATAPPDHEAPCGRRAPATGRVAGILLSFGALPGIALLLVVVSVAGLRSWWRRVVEGDGG